MFRPSEMPKGQASMFGALKSTLGTLNEKQIKNLENKIDHNKSDKNKMFFMETEKRKNDLTGKMEADNDAVVEAILALWSINAKG